jgi:hypothetical protein
MGVVHGSSATAWVTNASITSAYAVLDAGAGALWGALGVFRTNLTASATLRWRLGDDATFATATEDSGTLSSTLASGYAQSLYIPAAEVTARYMRLDVADATNPEGRLVIPLAFGGPVWQPAHQWSPDSAEDLQRETVTVTTRGGQEWIEQRWRRRRRIVTLPLLARADRWTELHALERAAADGGNILVVPSPTNDLLREPIFGPVAFDGVGYAGTGHRFRATRFTIAERL